MIKFISCIMAIGLQYQKYNVGLLVICRHVRLYIVDKNISIKYTCSNFQNTLDVFFKHLIMIVL